MTDHIADASKMVLDLDKLEALEKRLLRTFAKFPHDNHGGYGLCCGTGKVWVDDGMSSNFYSGGTCERCADNTPAPINPDGPEAAATIKSLIASAREAAAEVERLREAMTASGATKAAYHGEFKFTQVGRDEDGDEYTYETYVPWTTVKEIMAARANPPQPQKGD